MYSTPAGLKDYMQAMSDTALAKKTEAATPSAQSFDDLPFPTAMHAGYGILLRWLFRFFFARIRFPAQAADRIRDLAGKGAVVYVMRSRSFLSYLYFNWAYMIHSLPLARFVNGIWYELYQPLSWWLRWRKMRIPGVTGKPLELETRMNWITRLGGSSLIFLKKPRTLARADSRFEVDYILSLVRQQRRLERPIYLLPQLLLYHQRPASAEPTLVDAVFGNRDQPTLMRELISFLLHHRDAEARFGEPLDLKAFVAERADTADEVLARQVRYLLTRTIQKERVAVTGPDKRVPEKMGEMVLRDAAVKDAIAAEAAGTKKEPGAVEHRARAIIKRLFADLHYSHIAGADFFLNMAWRLTGIRMVYDKAELEQVREAARRGPLALCPMHRSHVDYLIVSQIFYQNNLIVPHIAAGDNLSFWPLGHLFRNMGAYFIRRTFKGDAVYQAIFNAYIKRLLREGWTQEFFIEGTRSRTGKMLPPKLGLLTTVVESYLAGASDDVFFIPISIMYEKVVEGESYMKELLGASKSREDIAGLIKTTGILTSRYGNIYVRFGGPVSLKDFMTLRGITVGDIRPDALRKAIEALGYDITHKIGAIATVAPSPVVSAVMLAAKEPLSTVELARRAKTLVDLVKTNAGVRLSPAMHDLGGAVRECVRRFQHDGMLLASMHAGETRFAVHPRARIQLDYYKNSLIHFVLPTAIAAATIRSFEGHAAPREQVFSRAMRLREILRYEFNYEVNVTFEDVFARQVDQVLSLGLVDLDGDTMRLKPDAEEFAAMLAALLDNFLESYYIAAEALALLRRKPLEKKEFVTKAQDLGRSMLDRAKIQLVESLSKVNIENALSLYVKMGIVIEEAAEPETEGKKKKKAQTLLRLADDPEINKTVQKIRSQLLTYLGRKTG